MARKRTGSVIEQPDGSFAAKLTVDVLSDGQISAKRVVAPLPAVQTRGKADAFALKLCEQLEGKTLLPEQLTDLTGQRNIEEMTIRAHIETVYLPSRKGLRSHKKEVQRWKDHLLPILGELPVSQFTDAHLRLVVEYLDNRVRDETARFAPSTAKNVWALVTKYCDDLQRSKSSRIRLREDNPAKLVRGPDRGREPKKQWLYPNEFYRLLSSPHVPVRAQRFYAIQALLCARPGEVPPLDFAHSIDLENRMVTIDRQMDLKSGDVDFFTKSDGKQKEVRSFPIPDTLYPVLVAMRNEFEGDGTLFKGFDNGATTLRKHLKAAGITRPALFGGTSQDSLALRLHDLRATGITYCAIRGDSDEDIRERAGHSDFQTTLIYIRRARMVGEHVGVPFQALPERLLHDPKRQRLPGGGYRDVPGRPFAPETQRSVPSVLRKSTPPTQSSAKSNCPDSSDDREDGRNDAGSEVMRRGPDHESSSNRPGTKSKTPESILDSGVLAVRRRGLEPPRELPH